MESVAGIRVDGIQARQMGNWEMSVSPLQVDVAHESIKGLENWLSDQWLPVAVEEIFKTSNPRKNLVQRLGTPSLFVRLDWIQNENPLKGICEVEDVIGGMGVFTSLSKQGSGEIAKILLRAGIKSLPILFSHVDGYLEDMLLFAQNMEKEGIASRFARIEEGWAVDSQKLVFLFVSDENSGQLPEDIRARAIHPAGIDRLSKCLMAKANPSFNRIAVSHGYDCEAARSAQGVVLKSSRNWGSRGVVILPGKEYGREVRKRGDTQKKIGEFMQNNAEFLEQDFCLPPKVVVGDKELSAMKRLWFGFDAQEKAFRYLGGLWIGRPSLKIHGASDSVTGMLKIK